MRRWLSVLGLGDIGYVGKWVLISSVVGVAAGITAVAFGALIALVRDYAIEDPAGIRGEAVVDVSGWGIFWVLFIPAWGGFLALWLTGLFAPEAEGHGTDQMIRTFHENRGEVRPRVIAVKAMASAITIGTGGSGGQEGPVCQIGGGVGSTVADALKLTVRERRVFLLAGASAGIGALFGAPLGGALFAPEVLYKKPEFEGDAIIPCIIASIVAFTTRGVLTGVEPVIGISPELHRRLAFVDARELLLYIVLAILCAVVSRAYVSVFEGAKRVFGAMTALSRPLRAALGGLLLGALALAIRPLAGEAGVLFGGYELMRASISGGLALGALATLVFAKILATSLTIGSGGSAGIFAPSLAIGALIGAFVGGAAQRLFPDLGVEPACYAFVGMGAFFAGVARTPISAIILVSEMTGSYGLLAPLMLTAVLHMMLASRRTLYTTQVSGRADSPAHAGEFVIDVLEDVRVADVLEDAKPPTLVRDNATLREALQIVAKATGSYFPVVDGAGLLVGIFSLSDVRRLFAETSVADMIIARDFMVERVVTCTPSEPLNAALAKMNQHGVHELPIVAEEAPRRVLAMLSRNSLGSAYQKRLASLRQRA